MKIASIDVGIKNLAICIFDISNELFNIDTWNVINLANEDKCSQCNEIAKYSKHDIFYCRAIWNFPTLAAYIVARALNKPMIVAATGKLYPAILDNMSYKKRMYWNL